MVRLVDTPDIQDALDELEELRRNIGDDILTDKMGLGMMPKQLSTIESSSSDEDADDDDESRSDQKHDIIFPRKRDFYRRRGRAAIKRKTHERMYPPACLFFLNLYPENDTCMDCGECNPSFAFSTFGVLLCSMCSSSIDHVESDESHILSLYTLDQWNIRSVLSTLIGGNRSMKLFLQTDIDEENQRSSQNFADHRRYSTASAARYCKNLEIMVEEIIDQRTPFSEDIFKSTTYWIAKYQPPNIFNANRALSALSTTATTTPTGTRSSTTSNSSWSGLAAAIANQSRRASFQATAKTVSHTKQTSAGSFRSSIVSFTSLFDNTQQRGKESSMSNVHSNHLTASAVSTATTMTLVPSADEVTLVSRQSFPPECIFFLRLFPGNDKCLDCGDFNPQFANTNFGILLCLHCCEKHCQIGFQSKIKSLWTDRWTLADVLYMMEGGNGKFLSCNLDNESSNSKSIYVPSTSPPHGNMATRTFSTVMMRRGSMDNSLSQVKSFTRRRRTMDPSSGAMDLAERYNCKLATQYHSQLTQRVMLAATKHGVHIPERYFR